MQQVLVYIALVLALLFLLKKFFFSNKKKKGCNTDCDC